MTKKTKSFAFATLLGIVFSVSSNAQEAREPSILIDEAPIISKELKSLEDSKPARDPLVKTKATNDNKSVQRPPQVTPYSRPNARTRFKRYINSTVGPFALTGSAASAGIGTVTNSPEEWGKDAEGFARRFASNVGERAIQETTIYGLDEALRVDSHFYRSTKKDFGSRFSSAVLSTVTARNKNGKRVVGVPRIVGTYGSRVVAREVWYPDRYDYKDGLKSGSISLGLNAMFNLFREFVLK